MTDYTKSVNFTDKDTLPPGDANKILRGTEIDSELSNVQTAVNSKADKASPTFTGTLTTAGLTASGTFTLGGTAITASAAEINFVDGVTSNVQTQLNAKQATITGGATTIATSNLTVSRALVSDGSGKVGVSAVTATELGYVDGVTSLIQTQLNGKAATSHTHATGDVTSGTFLDARIPNLAASKTTSGTFDVARIPDLNASKITAGTLANAQISQASVTQHGDALATRTVSVIGASATAVHNRTYIFTATLTLTLPTSPAAGTTVSFANRSATATPIIARNGQNIMGLAENLTVDSINYFGTLVFADATRGWVFQ